MAEERISRQVNKPQVRTVRRDGFTDARRQKFVDALALTCNVTKAAAFAGISTKTVFNARTRDAIFSEQWKAAIAMGYDRLEAMLLEHGGAGQAIDPDAAESAGMAVPFDFEKAIRILSFYRSQREGRHRQSGPPRKNATREETNAALMKLLAAAKRRVDAARARGEDRPRVIGRARYLPSPACGRGARLGPHSSCGPSRSGEGLLRRARRRRRPSPNPLPQAGEG